MNTNKTLKSNIIITYMPFLILFICMLLMHWNISPSGDDLVFEKMSDKGIISSSISRYNVWSSRTIVEAIIMMILKTRFAIWKVANSGMFILLAYSLVSLFGNSKILRSNIFACGLVLLFPLSYLYDATGWCAVTTNYWWPLALGVFSLNSIKYTFNNVPISIWKHILYILALLYAANVEQYAAAFLFVYSIAFVKFYVDKKIVPKQIIPYIIIIFISLIYIFMCPGNDKRYISEVNTWFPEFETIPFIQKISMGLGATLYELVWGEIHVFGLCCVLITILLFRKQNSLWPCAFFVSIFSILKNSWLDQYPELSYLDSLAGGYTGYQYGSITADNFMEITSYIPFILFGVLILFIMICLVFAFDNIKNGIYALVFFIVSIGIRCVMCFTPTIWASGHRTFIPTIGFLYVICFMLYREIDDNANNRNIIYSIVTFTSIVALLSVISMIYSINMS